MEIYSRLEDKHSGETHYGAITHTQRDTRPKIDPSFCVRLSILIKRAVSLLLPAARHTLSLLYLFSSTIYCQSGGTIQEKFPMSRAGGRACGLWMQKASSTCRPGIYWKDTNILMGEGESAYVQIFTRVRDVPRLPRRNEPCVAHQFRSALGNHGRTAHCQHNQVHTMRLENLFTRYILNRSDGF